MADKTLTCRDCGANFTFTESEQEFYRQKGFENDPQRCPDCRAAKKQQRAGNSRGGYGGGGYGNNEREMYQVTCAQCGRETTVPFRPSGDRPVYCRDCFQPKSRY